MTEMLTSFCSVASDKLELMIMALTHLEYVSKMMMNV